VKYSHSTISFLTGFATVTVGGGGAWAAGFCPQPDKTSRLEQQIAAANEESLERAFRESALLTVCWPLLCGLAQGLSRGSMGKTFS
jgi:hypothetical protein